ncbi:MAG: hypothetical protein IMF11_09025 [Proteobacteria bacterium]|nr:hypothetical protein [Pseudomonadota bacterium]
MTTLSAITAAIHSIIQDDSYITEYTDRINDAVSNIAGGVRMPDGTTSPPLPDLYTSAIISTTTNAYADLPADYQRGLFYVVDSSGDRILPPCGGNYYSFMLFLNHCYKRDLTEIGSVTKVCVKGKKFYYQGIPGTPEDLTIMFYKIPDILVDGGDEPEGIPDHLQIRLIKHYVCKEIFGEGLEDGAEARGVGTRYHTDKFYSAMIDLIDFIGVDAEPEYYALSDTLSDCQIGY